MSIAFVLPAVPDFDLEIGPNPAFCKRGYGRRLRVLGGDYTKSCNRRSRCLTVPNTVAGRAFAAEVCVVFGTGSSARVVLHPVRPTRDGDCVVHRVDLKDSSTACWATGGSAGADVIAQRLDKVFALFEHAERAWWERVGRPAAERREALKAKAASSATALARDVMAVLGGDLESARSFARGVVAALGGNDGDCAEFEEHLFNGTPLKHPQLAVEEVLRRVEWAFEAATADKALRDDAALRNRSEP